MTVPEPVYVFPEVVRAPPGFTVSVPPKFKVADPLESDALPPLDATASQVIDVSVGGFEPPTDDIVIDEGNVTVKFALPCPVTVHCPAVAVLPFT